MEKVRDADINDLRSWQRLNIMVKSSGKITFVAFT